LAAVQNGEAAVVALEQRESTLRGRETAMDAREAAFVQQQQQQAASAQRTAEETTAARERRRAMQTARAIAAAELARAQVAYAEANAEVLMSSDEE
jgi:hypothetical protein